MRSRYLCFYRKLTLHPDQVVAVELLEAAKIRLVDDRDYNRFRQGERYRYCGRSRPRQSVILRPTSREKKIWHLLVLSDEPEHVMDAEVKIRSL